MEWIKCTERNPERFVYVLVVTHNPTEILLAYLDNSNEFVYDRDSDGDPMVCHVTHWMPLPELPNE